MKKEELIDVEVVEGIRNALLSRKETLSVAESVTCGFVQAFLSQAPDALDFFQGGMTAYNLAQKYKHLNVEPIHATSCDCVSEKVANEMAMNTCSLFNSEWGLGITGYASPVPEANNQLYAWYAIAKKGVVVRTEKIEAEKEEPLQVQLLYTRRLLQALRDHLKKES